MRLDMHSREEVVKGNYKDYQSATKKGRNKILARLVPVCGMNRDYLAHKLSTYKDQAEVVIDGKTVILKKGKKKRGAGKHGGRPPKYDAVFVKVPTAIWSDYGRQCGKLLVPFIRQTIDFLCKPVNPNYEITEETRELLSL
ncbi:hypothetical protein FACS1894190_09530 [Spirochaetia bacterium]|nr:hypothetical protein FACS1894190_09530 [Spirochaetia bacterium]